MFSESSASALVRLRNDGLVGVKANKVAMMKIGAVINLARRHYAPGNTELVAALKAAAEHMQPPVRQARPQADVAPPRAGGVGVTTPAFATRATWNRFANGALMAGRMQPGVQLQALRKHNVHHQEARFAGRSSPLDIMGLHEGNTCWSIWQTLLFMPMLRLLPLPVYAYCVALHLFRCRRIIWGAGGLRYQAAAVSWQGQCGLR